MNINKDLNTDLRFLLSANNCLHALTSWAEAWPWQKTLNPQLTDSELMALLLNYFQMLEKKHHQNCATRTNVTIIGIVFGVPFDYRVDQVRYNAAVASRLL